MISLTQPPRIHPTPEKDIINMKNLLPVIILALAAIVAVIYFMMERDAEIKTTTGLTTVTTSVVLPSGLTDAELEEYFHGTATVSTSEKGLISKNWLFNLEGTYSTENLWESRVKYGFVNNPNDPEERPIGYGFAGEYLTANCAACHTSYIRQGDNLIIAAGGANGIGTNAYASINFSLIETLKDENKFLRFQNNVQGTKGVKKVDEDFKQEVEDWVNGYTLSFIKNVAALDIANYKEFSALVDIGNTLAWFQGESAGGGGHPFIVSNNLWFGEQNWFDKLSQANIPYLYEAEHQDKIHYNGSTNSLMERNIISTLNGFNNATLENMMDTDPRALHAMNKVAEKTEAPEWPQEQFGSIDKHKAAKGAELYTQHCQACHVAEVTGPIEMVSYSEESIGTDGAYFDLWRRPVVGLFGKDEQTFEDALMTAMASFKEEWYPLHDVTEEEARTMDPNPWWKFPISWVGRPMTGIWSTAPYLHNGSVPSLYHLLLPGDQRPAKWTVNNYIDTETVGIDITREPSPLDGSYTYDTSVYGNGNQGHEYGTSLSDIERYQLIEYLKTLH